MSGGRCCLCELSKKKYLCAHCFSQAASSRREDVEALTQERDAHLKQLEGALALKEQEQRRALQLLQLSEEVRESRRRVAELEDRLQAIRRRTAEVRQQNGERQARLREAGQQLGRWMQQAHRERVGQMEALGQNYLRSLDTLSREQRTRVVRRLLDILPVKLLPPMGQGQGRGGPHGAAGPAPEEERARVTICGLQLPDSRDNISEVVQLHPQLGSSLGYLTLLLDVLCRFLQLPLLHRAHFQASTSRLWQPDSFWDLRAAPPPGALLLFPPKQPHEGGGGHHASLEGLRSAVAGLAGGGGSGSGGAPVAEAAAEAHRQSLQRALHCLQRSAGALVAARLGPDAPLKVPPDWSPLAVLGGLCKTLAAEPRPPLSASRMMAVPPGGAGGQYHATRLAGGSGLAASAVFGRLSPQQDALGQSMLWPDEDGGDADDWDIIPRPSYGRMIPPPPSQPDDVEHWTQAMYPGAAPLAGQAAPAAPVAASSSPVDRIKSYLSYFGGSSGSASGGGGG